MADVNAIAQQIAGVKAVAPQTQSSVVAVRNAANWTTTVNGTNSDYFTAQRWDLLEGRIFMPAEEQAGKSVCVIGNRSEERRVGKECVSTCRSRWSRDH